MSKKGYIVLLVIIGIFSIGYFILAYKISDVFSIDFEETLYENKIKAIEKETVMYATANTQIFSEETQVYMTIEQLADAKAIFYDSENVISNPLEEGKTLNDLKVKITKSDEEITADVLE